MIEILKAGLFTTVQDLGRRGWQSQGVSVGGALDTVSLRVANGIVGNDEGAAAFECAWYGPTLRFERETVVAITGATVPELPFARPFVARAGSTLSLEKLTDGGRCYLAVSGGLIVPKVLESASTDAKAGFGGVEGRPLRAGDRIETGEPRVRPGAFTTTWSVSPEVLPRVTASPTLRAIPGPQVGWFSDEAWRLFWNSDFTVGAQSDRMGLRLEGPALSRIKPRELHSEAVAFGSVQVPAGGAPIVLLADRQTLGGYPKIANVISVDLPLLAHVRPGNRLRFVAVSVAEAQTLRLAQEKDLATLRAGLAEKLLR